jgi:hypothetical protein
MELRTNPFIEGTVTIIEGAKKSKGAIAHNYTPSLNNYAVNHVIKTAYIN